MTTVYGVFNSVTATTGAIDALNTEGYSSEDISVVSKENSELMAIKDQTSATGKAVDGGTAGGLLGGILGTIVGLAAITVTPLAPLLIAGPIAVALGLTGGAASAAAGAITGTLAGGLVGGLLKLGFSENDAAEYEKKIMDGGILVGVAVEETNEGRVKEILKDAGGEDVKAVKNAN